MSVSIWGIKRTEGVRLHPGIQIFIQVHIKYYDMYKIWDHNMKRWDFSDWRMLQTFWGLPHEKKKDSNPTEATKTVENAQSILSILEN